MIARAVFAAAFMLVGCGRPAAPADGLSPDEDRALNAAAAELDANGVATDRFAPERNSP